MKTILFSLLFALLGFSVSAAANTANENLPQAGDSWQKVRVETDPGEAGVDCLWYYSTEASAAPDQSAVIASPTGCTMLSRDWQTHFMIQGDTLLETGRENRLAQTFYLEPIVSAIFPRAQGRICASPLRGVSLYGERLHVGFRGASFAVADGIGVLTDGADSIANVMRVKRCRDFVQTATLSVAEAENFARFDSISAADSLHVLEYDYEWYAPGSRYPVMECHESYVIDGNDTIPRSREAWLALPESQAYDLGENVSRQPSKPSPPEERILEPGPEVNDSPLSSVDATLMPGGGSVEISYSLSADCDVDLGVYDAIGRQLARTVRLGASPGIYSEHLQLSFRPIGVVMLIVIVNDTPHLIKLTN